MRDKTPKQEPEFYTPEDLAAKLAVPVSTVKKRMYRNGLPGQIKVFGRFRFRKDIIDLRILNGGF